MKNIAIISLSSLFLSACVTTNYDTVVGTDSYTEVYQNETVQPLSQPSDFSQNSTNTNSADTDEALQADDEWTIVSDGDDTTVSNSTTNSNTSSTENSVDMDASSMTMSNQVSANEEILGVCNDQSVVTSKGQDVAMMPKFNSYLLQVISVQEQSGKVAGIEKYASNMNINYDKWKNKKLVNGEEWSTLLIGEFASVDEAKSALASLSGDLTQFSPFVVSAKSVYCAGTQGLTKL